MSGKWVMHRGPITDTWEADEEGNLTGPASCRCVHGVEWGEGGGDPCRDCVQRSQEMVRGGFRTSPTFEPAA